MILTGSAAPGGSTTQVQYNSSGAFAGDSNFTWSASTGITLGKSITITSGIIAVPNGTRGAPSISQSADASTGLYFPTTGWIGISSGGTSPLNIALNLVGLTSGTKFGWNDQTNQFADTGTFDLVLARDAANILAQRNGSSGQEFRPYGYFSSATSRAYGVVKSAVEAVTLSGATSATANIIPVGSFVIGVAVTITTTVTGASGFQVGDGSDADRWGDITGTAVGTDSDNTDSTANPTGYFAAASAVTLTAKTSNFTGGVAQVVVFYLSTGAD